MATKQQIIETIKANYKVEEVITTEGSNGYPRGLQTALLIDSWEDAQAIADKFPNVIISSLRKRDGWSFWESRGSVSEPYEMLNGYEYGNHVIQTKDDVIATFSLDDAGFLEELPTDKLADYLETASRLLRDVENLENGQFIANDFVDELAIYDAWVITDKYQMAFYEDVWHYAIAITFDLISEEDED
jgi:hypothetical protein